MPNTYIAHNVTLTSASLAGPGRLLLTDGYGTFTVDGENHTLELTSGKLVSALGERDPVNAEGVATVRPPGLGAFLINETMSTQRAEFPMRFEGPIFLAVKGVRQSEAAAAE